MPKANVVLHAHHHFYRPEDGTKRYCNERAYKFFFPNPSLKQIVENIFQKNIHICALSVCHTPTSGDDPGFQTYMKQLSTLDADFNVDSHLNEGWLAIERKQYSLGQPKHIILPYSQEVRTDYDGKTADINILGVNRIISHSQNIDETARIGLQEGGIVTICHANSPRCNAGLEKAIGMLSQKQVHALEGFNATESKETNQALIRALDTHKIKGPAVPDSHHYSQIDTAYAKFDEKIWQNFSREKLAVAIINEQYENHLGFIGRFSVFTHHTLPILMSIPGQYIRNRAAISKSLKKN